MCTLGTLSAASLFYYLVQNDSISLFLTLLAVESGS
jgi:hypothetical protein